MTVALIHCLIFLVEQRRVELLTSALRTRRSAKLSYCPTCVKLMIDRGRSGVKFSGSRKLICDKAPGDEFEGLS